MQNGQPDCKFPDYVNFAYDPIGKAASTREHPNTAQYFNFWISAGVDTVELGNIVAAISDDGHITFGTVVELRSIMDIENFLSDYISHDFGDPAVQPPSDLAEIINMLWFFAQILTQDGFNLIRGHDFSHAGLRFYGGSRKI